MATFRLSGVFCSSSPYFPRLTQKRSIVQATLNMPKPRMSNNNNVSHSKNYPAAANGLVLERRLISTTTVDDDGTITSSSSAVDSMAMEKLYEILEAVSDRVEMHKNIGEQRDNWNSLLLTSINSITLTAATISAIAATNFGTSDVGSLKICSTLLYLAATGMLIIMNKIQPSQLVEEQRNATRLFKNLQNQIQKIITIGNPTNLDVEEAMEKVLALDRAYPLPLLGVMLEKFPSKVEPAVWWPPQQKRPQGKKYSNGWNSKLEKEMKEIVEVIRKRDKTEYLNLGEKALKLNKLLAKSGPFLTGLAAVGSAFMGSDHGGYWAAILGVVGGGLASVVNAFEHGGQVGMVFEMYRNNAGLFKLMEESIESNLMEEEVGRRENGELLEMKVALQLGRSLSELRDLASSSSSKQGNVSKEEFASKLF
ncbi:hypothetical protein M9H77_25544 [Catharanthus roseus]|uniref:Uncharacterized protein n=1 Tax=Catharanthus roseus TaxID=4058 RepID=A0ACC0A833_CATRO|nr:hypothetical protein M9H77_25544 [Catharanthus roseus]